jgi:hypothetical protein
MKNVLLLALVASGGGATDNGAQRERSGPCDFALACAKTPDPACEKGISDRAGSHEFVSQCSLPLAAQCDEGAREILFVEVRAWLWFGAGRNRPRPEGVNGRAETLLARALQACPSAGAVYALAQEEDDRFSEVLDELHVPRRAVGDEVARLSAIAALPEPKGAVMAALAEAQAAAEKNDKAEAEVEAWRREAQGHLLAARDALAAAKYDDAIREADAAEHAGAAIADLRKEISAAKEVASRLHQQRAREFVKKNDPDAAREEVEKAEALTGGPSLLTDLREAIARTPKARHQEALRKKEARRKEAEARREEARRRKEAARSARCEALVTLCDLAADKHLNVQAIFRSQSSSCGQGFSAESAACFNEHSSAIRQVESRYSAKMARFQEKAERQLGRKLADRDCCDALPNRYRVHGTACYPW